MRLPQRNNLSFSVTVIRLLGEELAVKHVYFSNLKSAAETNGLPAQTIGICAGVWRLPAMSAFISYGVRYVHANL